MDPPPAKSWYPPLAETRLRPACSLLPQTYLEALHRNVPWLLVLTFAVCVASKQWDQMSSSWWLVLVPLWVLPWRDYLWTNNSKPSVAVTISATLLFAGLFYAEHSATIEAFGTWQILSNWRWGPVLSLPLQTILAGCATALVLAVPLHRILGRHSVIASLICGLPYAIVYGHDSVFVLARWAVHPLANEICLFDKVMPPLILAKACELLNSHERSKTPLVASSGAPTLYARFISGGLPSAVTIGIFLGAAALVCQGVRQRTYHVGELMGSVAGSIIFAGLFVVPCILTFLASLALWRHFAAIATKGKAKAEACWIGRILAAVVLIVPVTLATSGDALWTGFALSDAIRSVPRPLWLVIVEGTRLRISGEFSLGIGRAVEQAIDSHPELQFVELDSGGGSVKEAMRIGRAIKGHHLSTHVQTYCESACPIAFLAGRDRGMSPAATLGFHAPQSAVWYSAFDQSQYIADLENNGLDSEFLRKGLRVPATNMWYPTRAELTAAHVISAR